MVHERERRALQQRFNGLLSRAVPTLLAVGRNSGKGFEAALEGQLARLFPQDSIKLYPSAAEAEAQDDGGEPCVEHVVEADEEEAQEHSMRRLVRWVSRSFDTLSILRLTLSLSFSSSPIASAVFYASD